MAATIRIEVGTGELIDKITILKIKSDRITDAGCIAFCRKEHPRTRTRYGTHHIPVIQRPQRSHQSTVSLGTVYQC